MSIIKNILDKIYFHPLFYIVLIISLFTGHIRELVYFMTIILVHELGHSITGILLGYKLIRIELYPYGGCSKLEHDINIPLKNELLVLIMGPLAQFIFMYLVYYFKVDVKDYFYFYNKLILLFNLLPIYPLDGGKILNIVCNYIFSFYNSLKYIIYISYLITISFLINTILDKTLIYIIITLSLTINIFKEIKNSNYYFNKFLLERYLNKYNFKKIKKVKHIKNMKRDYLHIINNQHEKEYLEKYYV